MDKPNDKQGQAKKEPRCDQKQLKLLLECSKNKDMTKWNQWYEENPKEEIWLEGADLHEAYLKGANLTSAYLEGANLSDAHLEDAYLEDASLEKANLMQAHLEGVNLFRAYLEEANFLIASLKGADLGGAHLERASLSGVNLEGANLTQAHLKGADFYQARLERANISGAHLEGVNLMRANLEGADFTGSSVDGLTIIWKCSVNHKTDFRSVGLESCRIDERTKYLLEYNRRRMNSEEWYRGESKQKWVRALRQAITFPVRLFLLMGDYGRSTPRILGVFFALALVFAVVYYLVPGLVNDLHGTGRWYSDMVRACYFSLVTMTTLGFGDMYAEKGSMLGHILLMLQVLLGYVLLGVLVTRFGVLFKSGVVLCKFAKD